MTSSRQGTNEPEIRRQIGLKSSQTSFSSSTKITNYFKDFYHGLMMKRNGQPWNNVVVVGVVVITAMQSITDNTALFEFVGMTIYWIMILSESFFCK